MKFQGYRTEIPSVAIMRDGSSENSVVVTFQYDYHDRRRLYARCGKILTPHPKKIRWYDPKAGNFITGCYSSVAAVNQHVFIEVHSTQVVHGTGIWFHVGKVE